MSRRLLSLPAALLMPLLWVSWASAAEIPTRFATIVYTDNLLWDFNKELSLGGGFSFLFGRRSEVSATEEVADKVDRVVEKVENILEMHPPMLRFKIVLLPSEEEVKKIYRQKYLVDSNYIAFYSTNDKTIYISVRNTELCVLAHEIAHVVIHHYLQVSPSAKIHEVLAQYVESQLSD